MASARATRPRIGLIKVEGSDEEVPIYGTTETAFNRSTNWRIDDSNIVGTFITDWTGDNPTEFPVNFELVAGINDDVMIRQELFSKIKIWHSMCAGMYDGQNLAPPLCRYILGNYINCVGVLRDANVVVKGPWGVSVSSGGRAADIGSALPTSAVFTGTFLVFPGYKDSKQNVFVTGKAMTSSAIRGSFYRQQ